MAWLAQECSNSSALAKTTKLTAPYEFIAGSIMKRKDYKTHHFDLLEDFTKGDMPSLYRDLVLLKFTMLNMTRWNTENIVCKNISIYIWKKKYRVI